MDGMYKWTWAILLIIGVVSALKIYFLIRHNEGQNREITNRNHGNTSSTNNSSSHVGTSETGPIVYFANDRHGSRDKEYHFKYEKVGGSWRAYILRMPSLRGRDESGNVTHRLYDNGRQYVCWDRSVESLEDMQAISKVWADMIQEYIATGKRFG